jgi:glycerophosphoryl diester phosphodiesterase
MKLTIEGKGGSWAKLLTKELAKHHFKKKPNFISFNDPELKKFRDLNEDAECYTVDIFKGLKSVKTAKKNGLSGIDIHHLGMNRLVYRAAKKNNLKVIVWTVNSTSRAKKLAKRYPDISITTDIPDQMLKI